MGANVRRVEDMYGSLIFATKTGDGEKLAIFGSRWARRGSELLMMQSIERQLPGHFTDDRGLRKPLSQPGDEDGTFVYETLCINAEEVSYATGIHGATRAKIGAASGCIVEFIRTTAIIAGPAPCPTSGKDFLSWLLVQRKNGVIPVPKRGRQDITSLKVPRRCIAMMTGKQGEVLRKIEKDTRTYLFFKENGRGAPTKRCERLYICSVNDAARNNARHQIQGRLRSLNAYEHSSDFEDSRSSSSEEDG
eukprot:gnl/TRDRNA2_/TRDRNA2_174665_c4_seq1.p1 gnl/TRDRNA2_/TRDRNA2_174665_c4~~gnl/TRDRNA2_/TRDRNA2_174665_c4_seq1.p1  ORF type:complete len:269 (+),score=19.38 gnl/TRDRNA2_/TRDRNA2_174665_c4_seq1:61-807(+)